MPTSTLRELLEPFDLGLIRQWLEQRDILEIVQDISRLEPQERALVFRFLPKQRALLVFETLEPVVQQELIQALREPHVRELFEAMEPDDRARLLDEMPATVANRMLEGLSARERRLTSILLGYPDNSAGRIMSPKFVDVRQSMTVEEAIEHIRQAGAEAETIHALPVTDDEMRLAGMIDLSDLVLAEPAAIVDELLTEEAYSARAGDDQEAAARLMLDAGLVMLPITDSENHLVGIITADDAMDVLHDEDTEDIERAGGSQPLGQPYLSASVLRIARARASWLLVLILAAGLTVNILQYFEDTLAQVVRLTLFIPLLINTGGNVGSQTTITVVRAMAVGEVRSSDYVMILLRELRVGLMLGLILAAVTFLPAALLFDASIASIVLLSLIVISTLAAFLGSILPMMAKRYKIDPAIVSAPMITTIVDAAGLVIYFLIARAILGI